MSCPVLSTSAPASPAAAYVARLSSPSVTSLKPETFQLCAALETARRRPADSPLDNRFLTLLTNWTPQRSPHIVNVVHRMHIQCSLRTFTWLPTLRESNWRFLVPWNSFFFFICTLLRAHKRHWRAQEHVDMTPYQLGVCWSNILVHSSPHVLRSRCAVTCDAMPAPRHASPNTTRAYQST